MGYCSLFSSYMYIVNGSFKKCSGRFLFCESETVFSVGSNTQRLHPHSVHNWSLKYCSRTFSPFALWDVIEQIIVRDGSGRTSCADQEVHPASHPVGVNDEPELADASVDVQPENNHEKNKQSPPKTRETVLRLEGEFRHDDIDANDQTQILANDPASDPCPCIHRHTPRTMMMALNMKAGR